MVLNNVFVQFAAEETAEKSGLAVLGINPVSLLLQLVTFLLLYILLRKFAFGPIAKMLEQRRKTINDGVNLGEKMRAEHEKLELSIEEALHKARAEADKIVQSARSEASEVVKEAEALANSKTEALLKDAQAQIETATTKAKSALKAEMVELVAEATGVLVREKVDARKDSELINKALSEVNK